MTGQFCEADHTNPTKTDSAGLASGMRHLLAIVLLLTLAVDLRAGESPGDGHDTAEDVAAILRLAIDRGVPMFNGGDPAGCAAVYEVALVSVVRLRPEGFDASRLARGLAEGRAATDAEARAWAYRLAMDDALDELSDAGFEPIIESELPAGFPGPGPVGQVVLKDYPAYRGAYTDNGRGFWSLFNHIQRNDIAMTAPVAMGMDVETIDAGEPTDVAMTSMAFLYRDPDMGELGADPDDPGVEVIDWPAQTVLSIGVRGSRSAVKIRDTLARLDEALAQRADTVKLPESGKTYRLLGYNSPMVPENRRFFEVQLVVERVD